MTTQMIAIIQNALEQFMLMHHIYLIIRQRFVYQNQSQKSRSILQDGPRFFGLFWKTKTDLKAKLLTNDLQIMGTFRHRTGPSCSKHR